MFNACFSLALDLSFRARAVGKIVNLQLSFRNFHWFGTIILALMLVPAFHFTHLPLRIDWVLYLESFWGFNLLFASVLAFALHAVQFPKTSFEWLNNPSASQKFPSRALFSIFVVSTYFCFGFVLLLCYNDVVATLRFDGSHDLILNQLDSYLLFGATVTEVAHWTLRIAPHGLRYFVAFIYLLTSPLVSAGIIFLVFREGGRVAMRFVGCMVTAYYLSLVIFYFLPTTGPYYMCPVHPSGSKPLLDLLRTHGRPDTIRLDYFIGFPSMHIAAPTILLWYLRRYKRSATFLAVLLVLLVPAVIILEEHYFLDVVGGWSIALLAIAFVEWPSLLDGRGVAVTVDRAA